MKIQSALTLGVALGLTLLSGQAIATPAVWDVDVNPANGFGGVTGSWGLSDAGSAYAEWNFFESTSDSTPDVGEFGLDSISVTETTGGAFLTGGGNIYSYAAATDFDVPADPAGTADPGNTRTIVLRVATLGTPIDSASVSLDGVAPNIATRTYLEQISSGYGGEEEEWLFIWEDVLPAASYQVDFSASATSMSLDQLAFYSSAPAGSISAEIDIDTSLRPVHPDHDGSPDAVGGLNDIIRVVVIGADTAVGDPADLDVNDIDATTLSFGPGNAPVQPGSTPQIVNYDNDGLDDARFHFLTGDTGIACTDTEVELAGELADGTPFHGIDVDFDSECDAQCH